MRFFAAWGEQMDHMIIGNIWNKLGQQLRDDREREAWVAANGEVLARLRRRSVEVPPSAVAGGKHAQRRRGPGGGKLFEAARRR